jgi:hypothetical protein
MFNIIRSKLDIYRLEGVLPPPGGRLRRARLIWICGVSCSLTINGVPLCRKYSLQNMTIPKLPISKPWTLIFQTLSGRKYSVQICIPQNGEFYRWEFYNDGFGGCKWCLIYNIMDTILQYPYHTMVWWRRTGEYYGVVALFL